MFKNTKKPIDLRELRKKLQDDGLDPRSSDEEKLRHVWQLYLETQGKLQASVANIEELRGQQEEEMREVENYVEHIRGLSNEREALTQELEEENEQLKAELEQLQQQKAKWKLEKQAGVSEEISELLFQQGLHEIADSTCVEQVAYLLVERAKLLDELEAEQNKNNLHVKESGFEAKQLQGLLEQTRMEQEEELEQQKESMIKVKEYMKQEYDKETRSIKAEKMKLEEQYLKCRAELNDTNKRLAKVEAELQHEQISHEEEGDNDELDRLKRENQETKQTVHKLHGEITNLISQIEALQKELDEEKADHRYSKDTLRSDIDNLKQKQASLQNLSGSQNQERLSLDMKLESAQKEIQYLKNKENELSVVNSQAESLNQEKKYLETELELAEKEIKGLRNREKELSIKIKTLEEGEETLESMYHKDLETVKAQLQETQVDLSASSESLEREKFGSLQLKRRLEETQVDLSASSESLEREKFGSLQLKRRLEEMQEKTQVLLDEQDKQELFLKGKISELERVNLSLEKDLKSKRNEEIMSRKQYEEELQTSLESAKKRLEVLEVERDTLSLELKKSQSEKSVSGGEMEALVQKVERLVTVSHQMDLDNAELAKKLSDALLQCEETGDLLREEKKKTSDMALENFERQEEMRRERLNLQQEVKSLQTELQSKDLEISNAETSSNNKLKPENGLKDIRAVLEEAKNSHQVALDALTERLNKSQQDLQQTKSKLRDKEQELAILRHKSSELANSGNKLNSQIDTEIQLRSDLEKRNQTLEQEMAKVWIKMRDLLEKVSRLETQKDDLESELEVKVSSTRDLETSLHQRSMEQSTSVQMANTRADAAERRLRDLQSEHEEALARLQAAEDQLRQGALLRVELQGKKDEVNQLRKQLQDQTLQRSLEKHNVEELNRKLVQLREREEESAKARSHDQHRYLELEAKLLSITEEKLSMQSMQELGEEGKKSLIANIGLQKAEIETLQLELLAANEKLELQVKKYDEQKMKHKNKLQNAREIYTKEKERLKAEIVRAQEEADFAKANLNKELEWKTKTEDNYRKLLQEKRDLLAKNADSELSVKEHSGAYQLLAMRAGYLEQENLQLQHSLELLGKQKTSLEKTLRQIKLAQHADFLMPSAVSSNDGKTVLHTSSTLSPAPSTSPANHSHSVSFNIPNGAPSRGYSDFDSVDS